MSRVDLCGGDTEGHWAEAVEAAHGGWWLSEMESAGLTLPSPPCVTWENPLTLSGSPHPVTGVLIFISWSLMLAGESVLLNGKMRKIRAT